jgi:hypothetical protein
MALPLRVGSTRQWTATEPGSRAAACYSIAGVVAVGGLAILSGCATPPDWAETYAQVAVLEAAYDNCLRNSHSVGPPGTILPPCDSVPNLTNAGFLATDYVVPTVCVDKMPGDRPGYTTWMFVHQQWCDRGTLCPVLVERFKEDRAKLGLATAVDHVRRALSDNGLSLPDDEPLFARVLAGKVSDLQFAETLCSTKEKVSN